MRIAIDLDGTICSIREENETYMNLSPLPGAIEKIKLLKQAGHYIIINTARNMKTQEGNVGRVLKNVGKITLDWLEKHQVPYDEIHFGKPNAELYIDDRALRFTSWDEISETEIQKQSKLK